MIFLFEDEFEPDVDLANNTLRFSSFKSSKESSPVPSELFSLDIPNPFAALYPKEYTYNIGCVGTYSETVSFLQLRITSSRHISRNKALALVNDRIDQIRTFPTDCPIPYALMIGDSAVSLIPPGSLCCAPTLSLYDAEWTHYTIWGEPIYLKSGKVIVDQILTLETAKYVRYISPSFYELKYSLNRKEWKNVSSSFYGTQYTLSYKQIPLPQKKWQSNRRNIPHFRKSQTLIKTKLSFPISQHVTLEDGIAAINNPNSINFTTVMNEIFGAQRVCNE